MKTWSLRHGWTLPSDLASLELCKDALALQGIRFEARHGLPAANAIKMHGSELLEAVHADRSALHDLSDAAKTARWESRLPPFMQRYMRQGAQWFGIPMGIHQANLLWVNQDVEQAFGALPAEGLLELFAGLHRLRGPLPHPLIVGSEPWQVGLVFESVVSALGGQAHYMRAFEQMDPEAWLHPLMIHALEVMDSLRVLVDPSAAHLPWTAQFERLSRGKGAVQFMGDWVRGMRPQHVRHMTVPGTSAYFIAINDYFVPCRGDMPGLNDAVGIALTESSLQSRYARQKGCMPCVMEAWNVVDPVRTLRMEQAECVLPSFVFDQCGTLAVKNVLLQKLAQWFFRGGPVQEEALRLSQACVDSRKTEGLP